MSYPDEDGPSLESKLELLRICMEQLITDLKNRFVFYVPSLFLKLVFQDHSQNLRRSGLIKFYSFSFRNNAIRSNGNGVADPKSDNKPEVVVIY